MRTSTAIATVLFLLAAGVAEAKEKARTGWVEYGRANYQRSDYGSAGPALVLTYPTIPAPGARIYTYPNGVRVWYGAAPRPSLPSTAAYQTAIGVAGYPLVVAPQTPGPRVFVYPNGTRVWYGSGTPLR